MFKINKGTKINRIGEINYNKYGSKMIIIEYIDCHNIIIQFENGYKVKTEYRHFKNGGIINPYNKTVYGIGYIGEGKYKPYSDSKNISIYKSWVHMLQRCYSEKIHKKYPTYKECIVCKDWCNFQNFGRWYDENYYTVNDEKMNLDKDILHKGNKVYSPENCVFAPYRINVLFTKTNASRGKYPIGVSLDKRYNKFRTTCLYNKKSVYLGEYKSINEAFEVYKKYKEKLIKQIADEYKDKIPQKLYDAMYKYEVEITD